jgi:hypothetical protein
MRAFQPIARRTQAERNRNRWTPPPALRRIAWFIVLGTAAFQLVLLVRLGLFLLAVQNDPAYEFTHKLPFSLFQIPALFLMLACFPFTVMARGPRPRKKHIPDPGLSIRPR